MNPSEDSTRRNFPATAWTIIRGAQGAEQAARKEALKGLISIYWRPVYWQLRWPQEPNGESARRAPASDSVAGEGPPC